MIHKNPPINSVNIINVINVIISIIAIAFLFIFLILPLAIILIEGFNSGLSIWWDSIKNEETLSALYLTLIVAVIVVPINLIFGVLVSWSLTKFKFKGRNLIITLIDLPFAISPTISGLMYVLLFGIYGWFGPLLIKYNFKIIYAIPGIILVTLFVTLPFIARELIPLMTEQGTEEELAAISLGANGWQTFWKITLPNIKLGLLCGIILCIARTIGEFGAVSVVSGHIRGATNTLPLQVEILYNEYNFSAAFAISSLFVAVAILTLIFKHIINYEYNRKKY
ncbi:MAG: sulfate ABC transporter permease subunit CysW [Oligoflexia bacterium]|nr:sulfate ABC transporter permease subunit CysW [Oligoflexia bacterium]